jgi:hypothetical protein
MRSTLSRSFAVIRTTEYGQSLAQSVPVTSFRSRPGLIARIALNAPVSFAFLFGRETTPYLRNKIVGIPNFIPPIAIRLGHSSYAGRNCDNIANSPPERTPGRSQAPVTGYLAELTFRFPFDSIVARLLYELGSSPASSPNSASSRASKCTNQANPSNAGSLRQ